MSTDPNHDHWQYHEVGPSGLGPGYIWLQLLAWAAVPLILAAIVIERAADLRAPHESFYLLISLNFVFSVLVALFIAHLIGRSVLIRATPGPLLFGCGVLLWGAAGFAGATVGRGDANIAVTIQNLCVCLSAFCHLTGAVLSLKVRKAVHAAGPWLIAAYGASLCCVGLIVVLADAHVTPVFFVEGQGGTPLRQVVVGATIAMFILTAILLRAANRRQPSRFISWYSLALIMIAAGLIGVMIEPSRGGTLSWTGRGGQFLGGLYMLIAAVASVRESEHWGISLETLLREALEYSENLIQTANVPVIGLDLNGNIIAFNESAEKLTGYSLSEVAGRNWFQVIVPRARYPQVWEEFIRLRSGGLTQDFENPVLTKSGEERIVSWRSNQVRERGQIVGTISFGIDITERKQMENALRESEERFRAIASRTPDHILVQDRDLRYAFVVNPQLGLTEQDMIGRTDFDFLSNEDAEKLTAIKRGVLETGKPVQVELPITSQSGHAGYFAGSYVPKYDAEGRIDGLIGYFRNVTEQKAAELALQQARDMLENRVRERTEELTRAVETLNKEIAERTLAQQSLREQSEQLRLLAAELTLAEQRERQRLAQVLHDGLQQILVGAKYRLAIMEKTTHEDGRMASAQVAELIDDAIETSRSLTAELSPPILSQGGLIAALEWLVRWMQDTHGFEVELSVPAPIKCPSKDITVFLFRSTRELLFNALKHAGVKAARVQVNSVESGIQVVVLDEGAGFDSSRIRLSGGTEGGIGLFSMQERLHLLGGKMEIDSAPGRGTRVTLVAPVSVLETHHAEVIPASPEHKRPATVPPQPHAVSGRAVRKIRIVVADDHTVMRQGLARLIEGEEDMEVVGEASSGEAAVSLVREVSPDVVLIDISMPRMNGIQATKIIHAEFPDVRVIGLSMFEEGALAAAMQDAGAVDYLTKSGPSEAVIDAIRAWAGSREGSQSRKSAEEPGRDREFKA
jgi:PAS domain S-box-containing protein